LMPATASAFINTAGTAPAPPLPAHTDPPSANSKAAAALVIAGNRSFFISPSTRCRHTRWFKCSRLSMAAFHLPQQPQKDQNDRSGTRLLSSSVAQFLHRAAAGRGHAGTHVSRAGPGICRELVIGSSEMGPLAVAMRAQYSAPTAGLSPALLCAGRLEYGLYERRLSGNRK
jgi:hypothetical protein